MFALLSNRNSAPNCDHKLRITCTGPKVNPEHNETRRFVAVLEFHFSHLRLDCIFVMAALKLFKKAYAIHLVSPQILNKEWRILVLLYDMQAQVCNYQGHNLATSHYSEFSGILVNNVHKTSSNPLLWCGKPLYYYYFPAFLQKKDLLINLE